METAAADRHPKRLGAPCWSVVLRRATPGQPHLIGVQRKSLREHVRVSNSIPPSEREQNAMIDVYGIALKVRFRRRDGGEEGENLKDVGWREVSRLRKPDLVVKLKCQTIK